MLGRGGGRFVARLSCRPLLMWQDGSLAKRQRWRAGSCHAACPSASFAFLRGHFEGVSLLDIDDVFEARLVAFDLV